MPDALRRSGRLREHAREIVDVDQGCEVDLVGVPAPALKSVTRSAP
jgi:hypothetical protein